MPTSQKCHDIDGQDTAVSRHSGATQNGLASIPHHQNLNLLSFLFEKFECSQWLCTKDYQSSRGHCARQDRQTQREGEIGGDHVWILQKSFSFTRVFLTYTKAKEKWRELPPLLLPCTIGGPQAIEGRMCDASKSEARCARIQRAST
jgi:hypothetical protein